MTSQTLVLLFTLLSVVAVVVSPRVVYVGSFTSPNITFFTQEADGSLTRVGVVDAGLTPTWLETRGTLLFTTNEANGDVANFNIDIGGSLSFVSRQTTSGTQPTHLSTSKNEKFVLAANYGTGSVVVLPIGPEGKIGEKVSFSQHTGSGPNPTRQAGPHAHQIVLDVNNRYAYSPDLGADKLYQYVFDPSTGNLSSNSVPFIKVNPGDGPRHIAFHPNGRYAYLACELGSVIYALSCDLTTGLLTPIQRLSTLFMPQPDNYPAEVVVLPIGYVYVSNRGNDSVSVFAVDPAQGYLRLVQVQPVGGATPRGLVYDEVFHLFYCLNQGSGTITTLHVDITTGLLSFGKVVAEQLETPVIATIRMV